MDLMPSTPGGSSESFSQPHHGGCTFRELQQVFTWKAIRTVGYVYIATSWTIIPASKLRAHRCVHYPCYK
jgi:hypothetical protein